MRVLLVTGSFPPMRCGVGDYTGRLASALSRIPGIRVAVLTNACDVPVSMVEGTEVVQAMHSWHAGTLSDFQPVMRRLQPDLVHIQFPTQGYDSARGLAALALTCRFRWHVPVVVTLHEVPPGNLSRANRWIHALALIANRIVAVRPEYYAQVPIFLRVFIPKRKIIFVPNASTIPVIRLTASERISIRDAVDCGYAKLVAFFGFSYFHKGVDLLFRIADPATHHLLLIGELKPDDAYHAKLLEQAESDEWRGRVTVTGFVDSTQAAKLLAAADAAVFPYRVGGGVWNSSLHAATSQGTFALTTSLQRSGYDSAANTYFARPDDVDEMRRALLQYQGHRQETDAQDPWLEIARAHERLYASLTSGKA